MEFFPYHSFVIVTEIKVTLLGNTKVSMLYSKVCHTTLSSFGPRTQHYLHYSFLSEFTPTTELHIYEKELSIDIKSNVYHRKRCIINQ